MVNHFAHLRTPGIGITDQQDSDFTLLGVQPDYLKLHAPSGYSILTDSTRSLQYCGFPECRDVTTRLYVRFLQAGSAIAKSHQLHSFTSVECRQAPPTQTHA